MPRDLYRAMHKAMRRDLFEVSAMIAAADFSDADEVETVKQRFDGLVVSLEHHGEMEDKEVHPLAHELGLDDVGVIAAQHMALDKDLEQLVAGVVRLAADPGPHRWDDAHSFYLAFNRFVASYLLHTDREERVLMPALAAVADQEVLDRLAREDVAGPVEMLIGAMSNMMPLFNVEDRRQILADVRAGLSEDEYAQVADAAAAALGPDEWAKLAD